VASYQAYRQHTSTADALSFDEEPHALEYAEEDTALEADEITENEEQEEDLDGAREQEDELGDETEEDIEESISAAGSDVADEAEDQEFNTSGLLQMRADCKSWCAADRSKQGARHCAPGNMAHLCGACSYCKGSGGSSPARRRRRSSGPRRRRSGGSSPSGKAFRLATFNVYYKNKAYSTIARLIKDRIKPDIISLQEAVGGTAAGIVSALGGQWRLANKYSSSYMWCGLNAYRSDRWSLEWHKEIPVSQKGDRRGVCGALLRRKSDGRKICVWGTHPVARSGVQYAQDAVRKAVSSMKECSRKGVASVFMGDMNSGDSNSIRRQLESSTGWSWETAAKASTGGIDQIHIQKSPQNAGSAYGATTVNPGGSMGGGRTQSKWAGADHPPVYVDLK
jgi:endonuclease/exonuclease/phosphatase family metal-dependent hydrolase